MPRNVRGALLQASWTGDKESMIQKHEQAAHDASKQGAQVMLFQELFYGPYFCQVQDAQYYSYTELIPDGPTCGMWVFRYFPRSVPSASITAAEL